MEKGVDAFRTISEVAEELHLPQHVLRFWETRFPQIRPLKRGGGRRYYRPADVVLLRNIKQLLYDDGYTIKGVQRLFKERGTRSFQAAGPALEADGGRSAIFGDKFCEDEPDSPREVGERCEAPAVTESGGASVGKIAVAEALAIVEECEAILRGLRQAGE